MSDARSTPERAALPEIIRTERLVLRPYRVTDVDDVLAYAQDPEWSRFLSDLPDPYGRADAERAVAQQILTDRITQPSWAFELDGTVVGGLVLFFDFENRSAEVGYSVARPHWNKGLCTEALRAVLDAAFSIHEDLNRVHARTDPANVGSQRVLEKVGMAKEGVLRMNRVHGEEAFDEAVFSVLRSEWSRTTREPSHE